MSLIVFCGPMFGSKSTHLLKAAKEHIAKEDDSCIMIKSKIDDRYSLSEVVTHDGIKSSSLGIETAFYEDIDLEYLKDYNVVFIDEAQFMPNLMYFVRSLLSQEKTIYCAGLDMSSTGEPFGEMGSLLAIADEVVKLKAICHFCNLPASYTLRMGGPSESLVVVGGAELYKPSCLSCWQQKSANTMVDDE